MDEKELILVKALEVFGEKGFYLATIEEIACKSNFSKTRIGKYFKSKAALFGELIDMARALRKREVFANIGLTEDVKEQLSRFIIGVLRFANNRRHYYRILTVSAGTVDPRVGKRLLEAREEFQNQVYQILQAGVRQGKFRTVNPFVATVFLGKLIEGTVAAAEVQRGFATDQMILSMLDLVWNGLARKGDYPEPAERETQPVGKYW
jgi:AcrR family transcriptional regulator